MENTQKTEIIEFVKSRIESLEVRIKRIEEKAGFGSDNSPDSYLDQNIYNSQKGQLLEAYKILSFLQNS